MLLDMVGVRKTYGDRTLLDNIDFFMKEGDRVGVVGVNGCGKSTFLRTAAGRESPDGGKVSYDPNVRLGYLPQDPPFDPEKTVIDQVEAGLDPTARQIARYEAVEILTRLGIPDLEQKMGTLSGGQRKRVALASALVHPADLLLLDEPTNHLDAASREELENTLLHYDGTMLIVSHDRYFINKLATRVLELTPNGVQSYTGNYDDYMAHRAVTQQRTAAVKEKPKTNSYKEQKERASRLRKLRTAVTRLEAEIEDTEAEIEELQAQLSAGADYQALMDLTAKLDAATARRDDLYARWENASEELVAGEEEV